MTSTGSASGPTQRVFISYRRSDCQAQANGLYDGLSHRLSNVRVFMDIDSIPPGVDFEAHIRAEIKSCDVVLVLIGDNWLDAAEGTASRRIDDPDDFVRLEISSALALEDVRVIPVLVEGAEMPHSTDLPEDIRKLARYNAIELSDKRWTSDVARLARLLESLAEPPAQAAAPVKTPLPAAPARPPAPNWPAPAAPVAPNSTWGAPAVRTGPNQSWPAQTAPRPPLKPAGRSWWSRWGMVALPFFTCGMAAFVTPLWVIRQNPDNAAIRRRMIGATIGLALLAIAGVALVGSAPEDKEGSATGPLSTIGAVAMLAAMIVGATIGFFYRRSENS